MPIDPTLQARLLAQLEQINSIIASGADSASYGDKSTNFRDLNELYRIRDGIMRQLGLTTRARRTVAGFRSGFY
ncbi:phage head-tail joining protein [Methylobacterium oryzisoli]|uniref:phage head-tail joining protein n=1 Tax=Methylobacterium oryzisoli TaxID=3385502 RepID=UPI003891EE7C